MNQILIAIFFFLVILGFGFTGSKHFGDENLDDPDLGRLLGGSPIQNSYEPIINPEKGYIFELMARGFDVTNQSLFGDLSLGALKKRIFKYDPSKHDETKRIISKDEIVVYYVPDFIKELEIDNGTWREIAIYKFESKLSPLLSARTAAFEPRGYASQVYESSYYGRVSAESISFINYWKATLMDIPNDTSIDTLSKYLEPSFVESVNSLPSEFDETTQEHFTKFINDYGTHYLTMFNFGGMLRMESKTNDRFVEDVSESSYQLYLEQNLLRALDFKDVNGTHYQEVIPFDFYYHNHYENFTYGGVGVGDITCRDDIQKWKNNIELNPAPLDGYTADISVLIKALRSESNASKAFDKAVKIALKKYTIQAYLDALEVVDANLYGHAMAGHFNPVKLMEYFRSLLNEFDPTFNSTYEENCWCTQHCVESILNRRNWFPKPLPTKPTRAPSTVPTSVTTPVPLSTTPKTLSTTPKTLSTTPKTLSTTPKTLSTTTKTLSTHPSTEPSTPDTKSTPLSTKSTSPSTTSTTSTTKTSSSTTETNILFMDDPMIENGKLLGATVPQEVPQDVPQQVPQQVPQRVPQEVSQELEVKVDPVINPNNGYIFEFMSRGFDETNQSLFGNLSLEALKKPIFKYNPLDHTLPPITSNDGEILYYKPKFVDNFDGINESPHALTTVYMKESELNPLLNATLASIAPRSYASQAFESTYYGRISAESIASKALWKATLTLKIVDDLLDDEFKKAITDLPEVYNETTKSAFINFIHDYGTHYFTKVTFGGMLRMESKTDERFVEDVSEDAFQNYLHENMQRLMDDKNKDIPLDFYYHNHYDNFTYGGNESDISSRDDVKKWYKTIEFNPVAIKWENERISELIKIVRPKDFKNVTHALDKAIDIAFKKYRIQAYLDALDVVNRNLYGHGMAGHFNPVKLMNYFNQLLNENDPNFNSTYTENCWCTHHCVESILNRRNWFPKPLPIKSTKAPKTLATTTTTTKIPNRQKAATILPKSTTKGKDLIMEETISINF